MQVSKQVKGKIINYSISSVLDNCTNYGSADSCMHDKHDKYDTLI